MSCPDPLHDYEDFDMQAERNIYPWCDDESHDVNYDDHNDFYGDEEGCEDDRDYDDMDGDFDSAMRDAGFGTDEDYGYYGGDE